MIDLTSPIQRRGWEQQDLALRSNLHFAFPCISALAYVCMAMGATPSPTVAPFLGAARAGLERFAHTQSRAHRPQLKRGAQSKCYLVGEVSTVWALNPQRLNGTVVELDDHS